MLTPRGKLSLLALAPCLAFLAFTSREGRAQEGKAVPTDVRVVNPNTAPVFASVVNTASAPVQTKIVNALGAPVPANIVNPATTPVQAKIVNGPASPVQTSLVGQPTVSAKQNGAWNVSVANPATAPVPTYDARDGREPFYAFFERGEQSVYVPAGKRLVIEYVGVYAYTIDGGSFFGVRLSTVTPSGFETYNYVGYANVGMNAPHTFFQGGNATRIYADPETRVTLQYNRSGGTGGNVYMSISGYFLPAP